MAYIAESHLTPEAKEEAENLLDGKSIVYYANWLDNASHTPDYEYTKTWHYKNIDAGIEFNEAPLNEKGDILRALNQQIEILGDKNNTQQQRALALKMIVHLVGDLHQPLHMGHASDLGGNKIDVKFFKSPKNLHSVWDYSLVESAHKWSYTEWQQQIDRANPELSASILASPRPEDWAKETYNLVTQIYASTPRGTNIEYDYIAQWTPTIEDQLLKGGLRLASILNNLLSNDSKE